MQASEGVAPNDAWDMPYLDNMDDARGDKIWAWKATLLVRGLLHCIHLASLHAA
jgi:hypothetical protein